VFPVLPLPPAIEGLIGMPQTYTAARSAYLALITSEAEQQGLPPALADAIAQVESRYDANVVGRMGEVGLMQIRPQTAAMLGYKGEIKALFDPETNVRLGVAYLARAWQLAKGDVCRTLMKYRAGWGEERMTPLSVEYCRRARGHLAAIGSPLANEARPASEEPATPVVVQLNQKPQAAPVSVAARPAQTAAPQLASEGSRQTHTEPVPLPPIRLASLGTMETSSEEQAQARPKTRETRALPSEKNTTGMQAAAAPQGTSAPPSQSDDQPYPRPAVRVAAREVVKPTEPPAGALPKALEAEKGASEKNPGSVAMRAPQPTSAVATPSPADHRPMPAASDRVASLGTAKVRPEDQAQVHLKPRAEPLRDQEKRQGGATALEVVPRPAQEDLSPSAGRNTLGRDDAAAGPATAVSPRPELKRQAQTTVTAQLQAAPAVDDAARKRIEAKLQAQERRLRVTLKSICTGC
jgi:hypothetical protein